MNNYYKELPKNYKEDYAIDAKSKKTSIILTLCSLLLTVISFLPFIFGFKRFGNFNLSNEMLTYYIVLLIGMVLYIVLHELTHGIAYKILTHEKLTYGFTLTVAYCGVPNLYVTKKTALISLLAPFTLYSIIFILCTIFAPNIMFYLLFAILFAIHFGGCVGDLFGTLIILIKYRGKTILLNDTGPKQTFYILKEEDI